MTKDQARDEIRKELATAEQARKIGNEGMVRVCARRAAGVAIRYWLEHNAHEGWGLDAMSQLKHLQSEKLLPQDARDAAKRLTVKVNETFISPSSTDPIHDATIIIDLMLR